MPKINKTRYAILGVLNLKPCSGYDIKKFCDQGIAYFWNENFGHIYPVLKQMEQEGLITKEVEENEGRPPRHVYSITPKGQAELTRWLLLPVEPAPARLELLLKLYFAKSIPREKTLEQLAQVREKHRKRLNQMRQMEQGFISNEAARNDEGYPYWLAILRYGIYDAEFRLKWLDETMEMIKNNSPPQKLLR
ncbi:MAG TPA: PadR family transcriptional regulator [Bacillota bacterium]|nr:PadR family transcriptional regulator [Bacillota bacterium]